MTGPIMKYGCPEPYPSVVLYMAQVPPDPSYPSTWIPTPNYMPSSTEQEIGALKERVGRLEREMRKMVAKFIAKRRAK